MSGSNSPYVIMASETHNILMFGATGVIGRFIVEALFNAKKYSVTIFTSLDSAERKQEAIQKLKSKGAKVIVGDVRNEQDVKAAYEGI